MHITINNNNNTANTDQELLSGDLSRQFETSLTMVTSVHCLQPPLRYPLPHSAAMPVHKRHAGGRGLLCKYFTRERQYFLIAVFELQSSSPWAFFAGHSLAWRQSFSPRAARGGNGALSHPPQELAVNGLRRRTDSAR